MKLFGKNLNVDVAIVAEIGVNHEGKIDTALNLVHLAAEAGADAVKYQSYTPERYASASDQARLRRVTQFALDKAAHRLLAEEARAQNVAFFSTPLTEDWVPYLAEIGEAIKIASGDLTFEPVIRAAARTGKPVILSTGLGSVDEIDEAVGWLREEIGDEEMSERVVVMHCVSAYPTPVEEANVRSIPFLSRRYGLPTGYSNHVIGSEACFAAVALGAMLLEVHFTDRKSGREFRDHEMSFEPADLAALVEMVPTVRASLGEEAKPIQPSELGNMRAVRKGVVAARDIAAGATLGRDDLMYARPATEFSAADIDRLVGCTIGVAVRRGELIRRNNVAGS